jgi:hypothetical protein
MVEPFLTGVDQLQHVAEARQLDGLDSAART